MPKADGSEAAAPRPVAGRPAPAGGDGVVLDVLEGAREVQLVTNHLGVEPLLEEVADAAVPHVELLRVRALEALHSLRELVEITADKQVIVGRHQAVQEAGPTELAGDPPQTHEEAAPVAVVMEDRAAGDSARGDVVDAGRRERGAR